jgi:membrane protein YqaA with SNARE-associated domain
MAAFQAFRKMKFLSILFGFLFRIGYFGPLLMGALDSSFLVLPFGNDLVIVGLVAQHPHGTPWYVLSAACGSTLGALALALVSRKVGEEGLRKFAGEARSRKLKDRIGNHGGIAIAVAGLAPPPFPFTTVIAAAAALGYPLWRILSINFCARAVRFTVLSLLALKFGSAVMGIAKSDPFKWSMLVFILLCLIASGFSIWRWLGKPRRRKRGRTYAGAKRSGRVA